MLDQISVNTHSSIRILAEKCLYFDPFGIETEAHDADIIFFTHEHFDHFSPDDFRKLAKEDTIYVAPESMKDKVLAEGISKDRVVTVAPGEFKTIEGIPVEVIAAYNPNKKFHPKENNWVGYVVEADGRRIYVAGDTDATTEAKNVVCDVAIVPCGGTYTMSAEEAAALIDTIRPEFAIPTHYGTIAGKKEDGMIFMKSLKRMVQVVFKL